MEICFGCYLKNLSISLTFLKTRKDSNVHKNILVQVFCPLETEIFRFTIGITPIKSSCGHTTWKQNLHGYICSTRNAMNNLA